jgi:hypothetical protein
MTAGGGRFYSQERTIHMLNSKLELSALFA